jgi:DNA-directed RNA polymerase specialized sigma24 family protein
MIGLLALIARGIKDQAGQVMALDKLGVAQADIASLLDMNPTTVRTTLFRKRGKPGKATSKARTKK